MFRTRLCLCLLAFSLVAAPPTTAATLSCAVLPRFMSTYVQNHVSQRQMDEELEERTIDAFLHRFDPSRSVLLESEIEGMRKSMRGSFAKIKHGDCSFLSTLHGTLVERYHDVEEFVRARLGKDDYALDTSVELILDPEERGHPKTLQEQRDVLDSLIQFQMSNYLSAGETLEHAKKLLIHRYALRTQRLEKLEEVDLYDTFLDAFATSLDPHSNYLSAEVLEDFRISMSLSLEGIGVALSERDGYAVVERIIPGGAADKLNVLRPKDKLISVEEVGGDGEAVNIIDMPLREAVSLIRGEKGSEVRLTVLRQGERTERILVNIVRDKIDLEEQAANLHFEEREVDGKKLKLAILELPSFYGGSDSTDRQSSDDVADLLRQVNDEKADGLVLDLSRNGGGLLEHAVTISGFFIRKGEIVGIENARKQRQILSDQDEKILYSGPLVVHTSLVSASAAEILAGALKDYKRAVITGDEHTFGKGTVQTVSTLPPGQGALKITTAMFYRPGGKSTQNSGVKADIVIPSLLSVDDFGEEHQSNALPNREISPFLSSYANALPPSGRWRPISSDVISKLAAKSHERVAASEKFAEIQKRLAEAAANEGSVRLEDLMKQRDEDQKEMEEAGGDSDGKEESDTVSPQLEEATNILIDLINLES